MAKNKTAYQKGVNAENGSDIFFSEIISWAIHKGLEVEEVDSEVLFLNFKGRFVAMVDKSGVLAYHPVDEVHDILDEITKIKKTFQRKIIREC